VLALALILIPGAVLAQTSSAGPSAAPEPSAAALTDVCDLWTVDEVSTALGGGDFTVQPGGPGSPICFYVGTEAVGGLTQGMYAAMVMGDASTGSLIDQVRQSLPEAEELEIAGIAAIRGPASPGTGEAEGWSTSTLNVFPDPMVMFQLQATAPEGVDLDAALVTLVELAAARIASVQPPTATTSPAVSPGPSSAPAPSTAALTGLAALFPSEIGGGPVSFDANMTGPEFLSQIINFKPMEQKINKALKKRDLKAADLSFVIGSSGSGALIAAFQVKDAAIKPLVNVLLESLAMERTGGDVPPEDVAGKDAFGVTSGFLLGGGEGYAYPEDDVLWLVFAFGPDQAEIFAKLP
jgi:hypothetical protein